MFLPIVVLPVISSSGQGDRWYERGVGWPWHYGWQATDIRPIPFPSIVSAPALLGDLFVGVTAAVILWLLVRYLCAKRRA